MVRKKKREIREHLLGLIIMVGVCATALAFASGIGVDNLSQVAMGAAADEMCKGGADAKCKCKTGFKPGTQQCDGKTKGDGKIGCFCEDISAKTTGFCKVVGKCKGTAIEGKAPMLPMMMPMMMMGMPPMLPMIPMPMPSMDMPMMPQPCVPKTATSTTATTTEDKRIYPTGTVVDPGGAGDPNCEEGIGGTARGSWSPNFGGVSNMFASPDDASSGGSGNDNPIDSGSGSGSGSLWGRLMQSLGLSVDSEDSDSGTLGGGASGGGATGSSTGNVQSGRGNEAAKSTTGATTDFAIIGSGSTFSYAEDVGFAAEASVLEEIAKTLKKLLAIVMSWF